MQRAIWAVLLVFAAATALGQTPVTGAKIKNSTVDSTPIGNTDASTGRFTSVTILNAPSGDTSADTVGARKASCPAGTVAQPAASGNPFQQLYGDSFSRSDGPLTGAGSWAAIGSSPGLNVSGGAIVAGSNNSQNLWAAADSTDQWASVVYQSFALPCLGDCESGVHVRESVNGQSYYYLSAFYSGEPLQWGWVKNGVGHMCGYATAASGDEIKLSATGQSPVTVTAYKNGTVLGSCTDATSPISTGFYALINSPGLTLANWKAGTVNNNAYNLCAPSGVNAALKAVTADTLAAETTLSKSIPAVSPQSFGTAQTCAGAADDTAAVQAAVNWAAGLTKTLPMFNKYNSVGQVTVDFGGADCKISSPILLPSTGGGNYRITHGSLSANASWSGNALIQTNSGSNWYQQLEIDHMVLNGNHRAAKAIQIGKTASGAIHDNEITGFTDTGVYLDNQTYNVAVERNNIEAYAYGEVTVGAEVDWTQRALNGVFVCSSDNRILNNTIRNVKAGVNVSAGTTRVAHNHMYSTDWAVKVPLFTNNVSIVHNYFDMTGVYLYDPYTVNLIDNWFIGPSGAAIYAVASGSKNFANVNSQGNHIGAYAAAANVALTLSAVGPGNITITAGADYFDPIMVGSYIKDGGTGVLFITAVTDKTHASATVTNAFASTSQAAGAYTQIGSYLTISGTFTNDVCAAFNSSGNWIDTTQSACAENITHKGTVRVITSYGKPGYRAIGYNGFAEYNSNTDWEALSFKNADGTVTYGTIGYDTDKNVVLNPGTGGKTVSTGPYSAPSFLNSSTGAAVPFKSGTPITGKAACWKDTGSIGYCSTVLDATGACTCN